MDPFDIAIEKTLGVEGGYSDGLDGIDSGGETNWGVTLAVARAFGYLGDMRTMTRDDAVALYFQRFWSPLGLSTIAAGISRGVAFELFDTAVNLGAGTAGKFLQRCLNALNQGGAMYGDVTVDGRVGPMTIAALREYMQRRGKDGEAVLLRALNALQGTYYIELAERRVKDERFVYGWLLNRVT